MIEDLGRTGVQALIDEWVIGRYGERDRLIMQWHLLDGLTLAQLQRRLDDKDYPLSIDQLKRVIRKRTEQLERHLI